MKVEGNCFEETIGLLKIFTEGVLVHGLVEHPELGFLHCYAWVELTPNGATFCVFTEDGTLIILPQDDYYRISKTPIKTHVRYDARQAQRISTALGCGPWDIRLINFQEQLLDDLPDLENTISEVIEEQNDILWHIWSERRVSVG